MNKYKIAASILSADFAKLGEEVTNVLNSGADTIHFDVMDNHYVPNLTMGPLVCKALRNYGVSAPIDVHLMTKPVDRLILDFAKAGATQISFHPEASEHIDRTIQLIHDNGCKTGLAFNPATPLSHLEYVLDKLNFILIMSVNPGFGGQRFISSSLSKIEKAKKLINKKEIDLAVDGGVNLETIHEIAKAGADTFVIGSAIFKTANYSGTIRKLRAAL